MHPLPSELQHFKLAVIGGLGYRKTPLLDSNIPGPRDVIDIQYSSVKKYLPTFISQDSYFH